MVMEYALEMLGISKAFPGVRALTDVTLRIRRGAVHALLGENGAGKSTLVKILDGVYRSGSFTGTICVGGEAVHFKSPLDARAKGIGYVPQEIQVLENLSVAENIFVGGLNENGGKLVAFGRLYERAERLLTECGIRLEAKTAVAALNASQRQLVMIARALAMRPTLLVLDEATACLTADEAQRLFEVVGHLRKKGVTTLFITHRLAEVIALADAVTVLRDGRLAAEFERGHYDQHDIVAAMVGRKIEAFYPHRSASPGARQVLRVENLTIRHPHIAKKLVVENLGFSLMAGEILGLGGLVGSGRSETVNALYGRTNYTGKVFVDGSAVSIRNSRDARRHGIGLLPEERKREGLLFNFAIRENITLHCLGGVSRFGVIDREQENAAAEKYRTDLSIRAGSVDVPVLTLSGGNQQKVVLGKVLMAKPKILLLDEPTKGVDVGAKVEIYKLIVALADQGIGIVVISSDLSELLALSDRFIILAQGRIADGFLKADATEERIMLAATGGSASN
jgi:ABC-type sugar transport system ATPase subunit